MSDNILINGVNYVIIDTINYITLADSFVKNKIGTGHGEAKLYVGNESKRLFDFFENFNYDLNCFFIKKDFLTFLSDAESEFKRPQQEYQQKVNMPQIFEQLMKDTSSQRSNILRFNVYRVDVLPPRVYINSESEYYDLMRSIGIPNISYLSIMKLSDKANIYYYFRIFIDYKSDLIKYIQPEEEEELKNIEQTVDISSKKKLSLVQARIGQGEYKEKLLLECPYCPFTMVNDERLLIASHIKPWVKSNDIEKVDPYNGYIFTPTYDKLFDRGFITFDDNKQLIVSPWLSPMNQKRLSIYSGKIIDNLPQSDRRSYYLIYHRENIFKS